MFLHFFLFDYSIHFQKKACQLKLTGEEFTKVSIRFAKKNDSSS